MLLGSTFKFKVLGTVTVMVMEAVVGRGQSRRPSRRLGVGAGSAQVEPLSL